MGTYGIELALRTLVVPVALTERWIAARQASVVDDVPRATASLRLAATVALDELFFATEIVAGALVAPRERHRIAAEISAAVRLYKSRGWLGEPARYHRPPPALTAPLWDDGGAVRDIQFRHMRFDSGYVPDTDEPGAARWRSYQPNHTAHAWVLRHDGPSAPWLVCLPGYRMGQPLIDFTGFPVRWLHQRLGLNLIIPVLPFHGPRTVGRRSGDGFLTGDFLDTVHMEAQALWDIRRILSWVRTQGATRVGVYGLSLGGMTAALLAALDGDLDCVVAGVPAVCLLRLTYAHAPALLLRLAEYVGFDRRETELLLRVVSPLAMTPQVPRERLFLFGGIADRLVHPDHVRDLWHHWGRPRLQWYEGGHVAFLWNRQVKALLREALEATALIAPLS